MANPKTGRLIAAILVLIGAVLLIAAIFTPWYSYEFSESGASEYQYFYPGLPGTNGTIQYSCSGLPTGISCPSSTSYSSYKVSSGGNLNNTGLIAEVGFFMLIVGVILGVIGLIFAFMSRGNSRRVAPAIALAVLAMIMAIAAVGLYAALLPSAVGKDMPKATGSGPWSSFTGSASVGAATITWGPTTGFYLAIGAFVVLLIGVILLFLWRKEAPQPMAMPPPAPAGQGSMPPPTQ